MARATRQVLKAARVIMPGGDDMVAELYVTPKHGVIGASVGVRVTSFGNRLVSSSAVPDTAEAREEMTARFSKLTGLFFPHGFPAHN